MPYPGVQNYVEPGTTVVSMLADTAVTPPTVGGIIGKAGQVMAGDMVYLTSTFKVASLDTAQAVITATTSTTSVTAVAGAATVVTPTSMLNIFVGSLLVVDTGTAQETVAVTVVTGTTFSAVFTKTHATGFAIRDRQINLQSTTSITGGGFGTAGTGTALTVGALGNNFTVGEYVSVVSGAAGKEILESCIVTAKAATTITIATQGTYTQPFEIITTPVATVGNTQVGSQTITLGSTTNIAVGSQLLIDTIGSGVQETVVVTAVTPTSVTANFLNAHTQPYPVAGIILDSNAANFIGVSSDNSYIQVVPAALGANDPASPRGAEEFKQEVQIYRLGVFRFKTTVGDTYNAFDLVYLGADGQTVQKTANGRSIGRVWPDQRMAAVGVALGSAVSGAAGQLVGVQINPAF